MEDEELKTISIKLFKPRLSFEPSEKAEPTIALFHYKNLVPNGLKKKEYKELEKECTEKIEEIKDKIRYGKHNDITKYWYQDSLEMWIERKSKIKVRSGFTNKNNIIDIQKAKEYPIEQLLDFNRGGFVDCPWHGPERTPSLCWDKKRNKAHCFAGCGDFDSIDIYMKLSEDVDFISSVKFLI